MTTESKIIKQTLITFIVYFIAYTISTSIVVSAAYMVSIGDAISLMFVGFPSMYGGNLLPSVIGIIAIFIASKTNSDKYVAERSNYYTLLFAAALELLANIVFYCYFKSFPKTGFAILAMLIISAVNTKKKAKKIIEPDNLKPDESVIDEETDKQALLGEILSPDNIESDNAEK